MRRHAARRRSTRRHVDDSVIDPCPVGVPRQDRNSASASINFFDEPWAGHTIDLNFLAGDPFHKLNFVHGSLILVRSCRSCPLRHASNLYQASGGPHRRRLGRIHCRSDGRIVDLSLPRVPLAGEPLESAIQRAGNFLFRSHWRLRWRGTIAFFLLFQKGGPLSSVPAILAGGAAIMAIAGILFFHEPPSWQRLLGVAFAIVGLFLLRH